MDICLDNQRDDDKYHLLGKEMDHLKAHWNETPTMKLKEPRMYQTMESMKDDLRV
jgi:hypothetical protein